MATLAETDLFRLLEFRCGGHDPERIPEEWNPSHEVVVVRRGVFSREVEGRWTVVTPASVAFWNGDEVYRVRHPRPGGDSCAVFQLKWPAALSLLEDVNPASVDAGRPSFGRASAPLSGAAYLLHHFAIAAACGAADALAVDEAAIAFLSQAVPLAARAPLQESRSATRHLADAALELVSSRPGERLDVGALARAIGCSPFHLCRAVRRHHGVSIHQYRLRLRLRQALDRLLDTTDDIGRIALDASFASHSHFAEAFRREFGCPPSMVRRVTPARPRALAAGARPAPASR